MGFSLMELSVVLILIALISAAALAGGKSMIESARRVQTAKKLDAIDDALLEYRILANRLPCPADATLPSTDATYGMESGNAGACTVDPSRGHRRYVSVRL